VNLHRIRSARLSDDDFTRITRAANGLSGLQMFIDDSAQLSSLQLHAKARRLKAHHSNLGLIIVDYIQLMHAAGRHENRQQEVTAISRSLKALAKELKVPVIACSQLSRSVETRGGDKRPQLSDLRESGAIEQDADVVIFLYRPEYYLSDDDRKDPKNASKVGYAEAIVAKQRNGPLGTAKLAFIGEYARFANLAAPYRKPEPSPASQDSLPLPL
jgi:replicative DNA helicase